MKTCFEARVVQQSSRPPVQEPADIPDDALWVYGGVLRAGPVELSSAEGPDGFDARRLEAVLAVAFCKRQGSETLRLVIEALHASCNGDDAIANLRLGLTGLPRLPSVRHLSTCISMANALMANGTTPVELMQALYPDEPPDERLTKYDPDQARMPAGSGRTSGRWTTANRSESASGHVSATTMAMALRAAPLLAPEVGAATLAALSSLVAVVGFGAVFGVLFVPSPNVMSDSGPLPGNTGATYDYDHDTGLLRICDSAGEILAAGHKDSSGVFFDYDTGIPFARGIEGGLVLDGAAMAAAIGLDDA